MSMAGPISWTIFLKVPWKNIWKPLPDLATLWSCHVKSVNLKVKKRGKTEGIDYTHRQQSIDVYCIGYTSLQSLTLNCEVPVMPGRKQKFQTFCTRKLAPWYDHILIPYYFLSPRSTRLEWMCINKNSVTTPFFWKFLGRNTSYIKG